MNIFANHFPRMQRILLSVVGTGWILLGAPSALAVDSCIQDVWKAHGNSQNLTCTAGDVKIAEVTNINITSGGSCTGTGASRVCSCLPGNVTFTADYKVLLTAQTRYDIGLYFGVDGDSNNDGALTGTCTAKIITPGEEATGSSFVNLDNPNNAAGLPADQCGDIDDAHNPQLLTLTLTTACVGDPVTQRLKLPNCTTWRQPGSNGTCTTTFDAFPGSPSKCNCQPGFTVNILAATPTLTTTKTANPTTLVEGATSPVTFSVSVKNNGTIPIHLEKLTDDQYGNVTAATPTNPAIDSTTCGPLPLDIAAGGTYNCSFVAPVAVGNAGDVHTDVVCASGHDTQSSPVGGDTQTVPPSSYCDDATVTASDSPVDATLTKTVKSADVTYEVEIKNTSQVDTLTLTRLCDDKFGDISGNQASDAACPAKTGTGVLVANTTTCPNLPKTLAAGATIKCTFVGTITESNKDTVTATLQDPDHPNSPLIRQDDATVSIP